MARAEHVMLELDGREVRFSNPSKVYFPQRGYTKLDLCRYYLEVAEPCLLHLRDRPTTMKRFPGGIEEEFFFQKRVPRGAPDWLEQMTLSFPSGRSANFLVCDDRPGSLDALLELAARDERQGLGDAPWPPHFPKRRGEGPRVAPSRARKR